MPRVRCPECGQSQVIGSLRLGQRVECDECGETIPTRKPGPPAWVFLVAAGGLGLVLLLVVGGIVAARVLKKGGQAIGDVASAVAGPSADREGETWSHKELLEFLKDRGVLVDAFPTHHGAFGGPAVYAATNAETLRRAAELHQARLDPDGPGVVYIQKLKTIQDAKDQSAMGGRGGHHWGRFQFLSEDKALTERIRKALPN